MIEDWVSLLLRWAHIVAGIGWIGSSFYFMWLDSSLKRAEGMPAGVKGENWSVHGGGFYHIQKYAVAPERMPADLHWFKWESYSTWLTGFALLAVVYYWGAESYMIDRSVADITQAQAILISLVSLAAGWLVYDRLCKSALADRPVLVFALLFAFICFAAWAWGQVFSARAAFLHVGAMTGTIMTGNVFLVIIPNQRIVVADLKAGRTPDAKYGRIAKLRSTHNNYLTLPVLFMMISNHYPMTFGHEWNVVIVAVVLLLGVVIRHWFNLHEAGAHGPKIWWQWPVAGALTAFMMAFSAWKPNAVEVADPVFTPEALAIATVHCASCHADVPSDDSFDDAPAGVMLHTASLLKSHASRVLAQAVLTNAMPMGNDTGMTEEERARLGAWIRAGMPDE
ncbi:MAG: urate hydroxylase PuuD [Rubrimonas sp.]|uniref:urate hydroxylase PuuD n=1 Tax=Rubrimonas sp. TaxID=2036015 RepID=UPI002FDD0DDA